MKWNLFFLFCGGLLVHLAYQFMDAQDTPKSLISESTQVLLPNTKVIRQDESLQSKEQQPPQSSNPSDAVVRSVSESTQAEATYESIPQEVSFRTPAESDAHFERVSVALDPQRLFDAEPFDAQIAMNTEQQLRQIFESLEAVKFNLGLQAIECKARRCRMDVYPLDGLEYNFNQDDIQRMFLYKNIRTFADPEIKNGIRVFYTQPEIPNEELWKLILGE